ncbi:toxin-antitoxin system YwqK family antitoxin [Flavobacterium sp. DSP2-3-1]|uniref:toxin-antitoxin system YwqK family antitoxin n=1 Tax=Flavobacterium sp. DSP2-3-1 TaxID=2804620 RepID=UPI003CE79B0F
MTNKLLILISILVYGCQNVDINDTDKRNENWIYWIDKNTGNASWVKVGVETTVNDGSFTSFYKNGNIYQKGKLKNGKRIDTIYDYDLKNNLLEYEIIKPDTLIHYYINNGPYISYLQNGKILEKGNVENHQIGNEWTKYYDNGKIDWTKKLINGTGSNRWYYKSGQISAINYHVNGKTNGEVKMWFENGQIKEISNWNDGLQNGNCETYYENGNPKDKANWINDKLHGKRESWYENGKEEQIEFYNNGVRNGQIIQWYQNGNKKATIKFIAGQISGKVINYYENGNVKGQGNYKDGNREGVFSYYDENGKLTRTQIYIKGEIQKDEQ